MKKEENKKRNFIELWKDKRERAKIELILYGIFFIVIVIFARTMGSNVEKTESNNYVNESFVSSISDNYEYDIKIAINGNIYEYYGKVLGNNSTINLKIEDKVDSYYMMNKKYYVVVDDNYILTNEDLVYPYIDYHYLNIDNIKEYIDMSTLENGTYKVNVSDIILNSESTEYVTIDINEGDRNMVIDYTSLFKVTHENIDNVVVNITYDNINNIISLGE